MTISNDIWSQEAARLFPSSMNKSFDTTVSLQRQAFMQGVLFALSQVVTSTKLVMPKTPYIGDNKAEDTDT